MIGFRRGGNGERSKLPYPADGEPRLPDHVLEHFDFEHEVFQGDPWPEVAPAAESLPEAVKRAAEEMKSLVDRQAGTKQILMALEDTLLDRERPADRYVDDRLVAGDTREQIRADVQAAHDALGEKLDDIRFEP